MTATRELIEHPSKHFASPMAIVESPALDTMQKLQSLDRWMADIETQGDLSDRELLGEIEEARDAVSKANIQHQQPNAEPAPNRSWQPGNPGQGGEGLSKGYGGSAGKGLGPAGPEDK